jgi:Pilus formation protein N terminal region/TadE-like protein
MIRLPERTSTIVIGNPLIADASLQAGGVIVLTGKSFGATNFVALDRSGAVLMERTLRVEGPREQEVVVYRGVERETYTCAPKCEKRITPGDAFVFFGEILGRATDVIRGKSGVVMCELINTRLTGAARQVSAFVTARPFVKRQDGAVAIEFAMVAAPFLALMFAIMETALVFFAGQALETAAADSARMIMTGQAQTQQFSNADFKNAVWARFMASSTAIPGSMSTYRSSPRSRPST